MTEHVIQCAAVDVADRIMEVVASFIPEPERAAMWGRIFAEVQAGIVAVAGAERQQEKLQPSRN